jgi:hypothetical protein
MEDKVFAIFIRSGKAKNFLGEGTTVAGSYKTSLRENYKLLDLRRDLN